MKIAVTGAHKVGKTTLIENLRESLPEYEFKAEPYYELEDTGFVFSDVPAPEDYLTMLEYSIEQITSSEENVLFDRCPVDLLAYIQAVDEFQNINIQSLYQKVQNAMSEIDLLIFVPVQKPDLITCSASDLPELRHEVNSILNDLVWDFNINTLKVTGSPSSQIDLVLKKISEIK